jgi:hypothetical protein
MYMQRLKWNFFVYSDRSSHKMRIQINNKIVCCSYEISIHRRKTFEENNPHEYKISKDSNGVIP